MGIVEIATILTGLLGTAIIVDKIKDSQPKKAPVPVKTNDQTKRRR